MTSLPATPSAKRLGLVIDLDTQASASRWLGSDANRPAMIEALSIQ